MRLRELGLSVGSGTPGPHNAITDIPGVVVGHTTLIRGDGPLVVGRGPVRTGVTVVIPPRYIRRSRSSRRPPLNGNGELTGLEWVRESGMRPHRHHEHPQRGRGPRRAGRRPCGPQPRERVRFWSLPVVGETYDGALNDMNGSRETLACRRGDRGRLRSRGRGQRRRRDRDDLPRVQGRHRDGVARCLAGDGGWTVGALVQANYGSRELLVDGVPVRPVPAEFGRAQCLVTTHRALAWTPARDRSSSSSRPTRLCSVIESRPARAAGRPWHWPGWRRNVDSSGDIFLAFSTARQPTIPAEYFLPASPPQPPSDAIELRALPHTRLSPLFAAVAEATEEAILNALLAGRDMTGRDGITAHGLTPDLLGDAFAGAAADLASIADSLGQAAGHMPSQ